MKQTYGILGIVGAVLLLMGAVGVYAYGNTDNVGWGMMGNNQATYNEHINSNVNYGGMMGTLDTNTINQMNEWHDEMIKNLDPETAKQLDEIHDACLGNTD